jgi:NADH:ubiquinone reductase (H+-translocating)
MSGRHKVVIVGGGFAGLSAAQGLKGADVEITLVDRNNYHLFQPLLYQVATGGLSPANIAAPLRSALAKQKNCRVILGDVTGFDIAGKRVLLGNESLPYDSLIVAAGAGNNYFGNDRWEAFAPGLKTIEEATEIRRRVLSAFEEAERAGGIGIRDRLLTFVVVGAGPTGVEMAGAISELAKHTMRHEFRLLDPSTARILLVEHGPRILPPFPESLSAKAETVLRKMGVEVWTSSRVLDIRADCVVVERNGAKEEIPTRTVVWAAGVKASPLGKRIAEATNATVDRAGRVVVQPDLTLPDHPEIFVAGDLASVASKGSPVPGVAPAAIQMGKFAARTIRGRLAGSTKPTAFAYWDKGSMATIGRNAAVVHAGFLKMSGFIAWVAWLFVHILYLIHFSNRLMVMFQWFWNYVTRNRSARLITHPRPEAVLPPVSGGR